MIANVITPSAALTPYIRKYLVIESAEGSANRVLPDTSLVMAFRFKGDVNYTSDGVGSKLPSAVISGLRNSARIINYSQNSGTILVIFKEAIAAALFKAPAYELFNNSLPLDNLFARQDILQIEEQLAGATGNAQRIFLVENFLLSHLTHIAPDKLVLAAVQKIDSDKGHTKIKDLANSLYISQDAFEKRFRKATGASPKQYSSIVRIRALVGKGITNQSLSEMAYAAGYFDQPHFNKDFKLFTGLTPTGFFKSPLFW